jgi:hypothetical protein
MDDATARTRSIGRRMATVKPSAAPRRGTTPRSSKKGAEPQVSPARWAGVALVMTAILAASMLAMLSPSDPGNAAQPGIVAGSSPSPVPSVLDDRVPTAKPTIVSPAEGITDEVDIDVVAQVPDDPLPRNMLTLVVLSGDEEIGQKARPALGGRVTVKGVRLVENSLNELTVALKTDAGVMGPSSDPVMLTHDEDAPGVVIVSPEDGHTTLDKTVEVTVASEAGAEVRISNKKADFGPARFSLGPAGEGSKTVRLAYGTNVIVVESEDQAGNSIRPKKVRVTRTDLRPQIVLKKAPKSLRKSTLPKAITLKVEVTDKKGKPMADATVDFTLGAAGYPGDTGSKTTDAEGRASWTTEVPWSDSLRTTIPVTVTATSASGESIKADWDIVLK